MLIYHTFSTLASIVSVIITMQELRPLMLLRLSLYGYGLKMKAGLIGCSLEGLGESELVEIFLNIEVRMASLLEFYMPN